MLCFIEKGLKSLQSLESLAQNGLKVELAKFSYAKFNLNYEIWRTVFHIPSQLDHQSETH